MRQQIGRKTNDLSMSCDKFMYTIQHLTHKQMEWFQVVTTSRAEFTYRLNRLKPRASVKMEGLGENEGPHHEQRRPFLFFALQRYFSENTTSEDVKTDLFLLFQSM